MPSKRTLEAFFSPAHKKPRPTSEGIQGAEGAVEVTRHRTYPFPIACLPAALAKELPSLPARPGRAINDQPHLDLLYFGPFIPQYLAKPLFEFLRTELPFYRVEYDIKRGGVSTHIRTPRWTTVFGLDETSKFDGDGRVVDAKSALPVSDKLYDKNPPRPMPKCLDELRRATEAATDCKFNFCLVNYYASGADSISFHSDDERFLGPDPAIASFSFGAKRDFLMKHKPPPNAPNGAVASATTLEAAPKPLKLTLENGDMILMRGKTQSNWLHSIPKRTGKNQEDGGRINITFRQAMTKGGTENYYNYNVGHGPVYRWDKVNREMTLWKA